MKKEDIERMLLSEEYFLEHWIVQFTFHSDTSAFCLGFRDMKKRLEWVKSELKKLKNEK